MNLEVSIVICFRFGSEEIQEQQLLNFTSPVLHFIGQCRRSKNEVTPLLLNETMAAKMLDLIDVVIMVQSVNFE